MATTTETVNKTTVVEVVKEADVVNRQEVKGTTDIVFIVDKSGSMDSHITDVANNIEKFVRDLESKNVQARLGLVDYESSKTQLTMISEVLNSPRIRTLLLVN
ncbi:MAG: VWA domain-containing protein [Streptococcus salivarius]